MEVVEIADNPFVGSRDFLIKINHIKFIQEVQFNVIKEVSQQLTEKIMAEHAERLTGEILANIDISELSNEIGQLITTKINGVFKDDEVKLIEVSPQTKEYMEVEKKYREEVISSVCGINKTMLGTEPKNLSGHAIELRQKEYASNFINVLENNNRK